MSMKINADLVLKARKQKHWSQEELASAGAQGWELVSATAS